MARTKEQEAAIKKLQRKIIWNSLGIGFKSVVTLILLMVVVSIVNIVFVHNPEFQQFGAFISGCAVLWNLLGATKEREEDYKAELRKIMFDASPDQKDENETH